MMLTGSFVFRQSLVIKVGLVKVSVDGAGQNAKPFR